VDLHTAPASVQRSGAAGGPRGKGGKREAMGGRGGPVFKSNSEESKWGEQWEASFCFPKP